MLDSTYESSGDFPLDSALVKMKPDNAFFQSDIDVNREKNIMVVANRWWGIIEICDLKSGEWNRYFGPIPVSYTHLDVYKRQVISFGGQL